MNKQEFEDMIFDLLSGQEVDGGVLRVTNFEEMSILTSDKGLVVSVPSGEKFTLTIGRF